MNIGRNVVYKRCGHSREQLTSHPDRTSDLEKIVVCRHCLNLLSDQTTFQLGLELRGDVIALSEDGGESAKSLRLIGHIHDGRLVSVIPNGE